MRAVAIYDLDETVTLRPTLLRWLLFWVGRRAPWRAPLLAFAGLASVGFALGVVSRARLKEVSLWAAMGKAPSAAAVAAVARAFATREVATNMLSGALASIAADRARGATLVLATASMAFYARALGDALGFDMVIGTEAHVAGARQQTRIAGENCYGQAKLRRAEAWAADARAAMHVTAYSDSASDTPLLAWADAGVAVNPKPAFAAAATERGWRVARW